MSEKFQKFKMDSEEAECSRDHETVKRQANECGHDREVKQEGSETQESRRNRKVLEIYM